MNPRSVQNRGFVLLEAILAVAIFALGVLALGQCVSNCVAAEHFREEDARARRALQNRMAEIEGGSVPMSALIGPAAANAEELKEPFEGMKMRQVSVPVKKKNEKEQELSGIFAVTLEVSWESAGDTHTKELMFYVSPRQK